MFDITVSIVLFHSSEIEVRKVLKLINRSPLSKKIYLIDNSKDDRLRELSAIKNVEYIFNDKNLGYGTGHNIAIEKAKDESRYHLIMNSDVDFNPDILEEALRVMELNENVGMLSPKIVKPDGSLQHFCRLLPTPFDLFARRFIPKFLKPFVQKQLDKYILIQKDYSVPMNIPNLPGCFMFARSSALSKVGGFDENFFLYVEDVDLTRRLHDISVTLYYPKIEVIHHLSQGSYKFTKLVWYHIVSAIYYFKKWGWMADGERERINYRVLVTKGIKLVVPETIAGSASAEKKYIYEVA